MGQSWGMDRIIYFWNQQIAYMNGHFSIWGFGEHHMVEYLLYGTRRIPMEYEKKPDPDGSIDIRTGNDGRMELVYTKAPGCLT